MKVLIAGDFCPSNRVVGLLNSRKFEELYGEIRIITETVDYSIVNLECPVSFGNEPPIVKCGPSLRFNEKSIEAIKYMGFDAVSLANNHFYDYGENGVFHTLDLLNKSGLDYVGGGRNIEEASKTLYKKIGGKILAIVNCCEHEFSIAGENNGGSNPLNPIKQFYAIKEAKKRADYVLVVVHGGLEGYNLPLPRMQETYRFFVEAGANAVVNHHQHCYSGYEIYHNSPIFYGLGNFSFDGLQTKLWTEGFMVSLNFEADAVDYELIPYVQGRIEPGIRIMQKKALCDFKNQISVLSDIIKSPCKIENEFSNYAKQHSTWYRIAFEPWGKGFRVLRSRGWLPSLVSKTKWLSLADYMICETHSDVIREYFKDLVTKYNSK